MVQDYKGSEDHPKQMSPSNQPTDGENPYPKLKLHVKEGKHPKTYVANEKTICEECGEILGDAANPVGM